MPLLAILISLVIWGLIFWLIHWGLGQFALPEPFAMVIKVVLVLAAILVVIGLLTGATWVIFPIAGAFGR